ncbi:hypothetical protein [Microbulbifer sp. PSTR4-B]|uniref:hypothetical protein n=1 Tax=Microbulbifer sp. PSTR4-B TaxID=3243396 RepID=UPI00403A533D
MLTALVGAVAIGIGGRFVTRPKLNHFSRDEFGIWYPLMSADLLQRLDRFRTEWGGRVIVSKAEGGIGREDDSNSQHNVTRWGEVLAIDVFPQVQDVQGNWHYLNSPEQLERAYQVARSVGFTGIGLYTDTQPGHMVHLDVRPGDHIATWSRIAGEYRGISEALA